MFEAAFGPILETRVRPVDELMVRLMDESVNARVNGSWDGLMRGRALDGLVAGSDDESIDA